MFAAIRTTCRNSQKCSSKKRTRTWVISLRLLKQGMHKQLIHYLRSVPNLLVLKLFPYFHKLKKNLNVDLFPRSCRGLKNTTTKCSHADRKPLSQLQTLNTIANLLTPTSKRTKLQLSTATIIVLTRHQLLQQSSVLIIIVTSMTKVSASPFNGITVVFSQHLRRKNHHLCSVRLSHISTKLNSTRILTELSYHASSTMGLSVAWSHRNYVPT